MISLAGVVQSHLHDRVQRGVCLVATIPIEPVPDGLAEHASIR